MSDDILSLARQHNRKLNSSPAPANGKKIRKRPKWPIVSEAAAVHPSQVQQFTEFHKRHGTPTEYLPTGEPVFQSHAHQRKSLRDRQMHNKLNYC